MNFKTTFPVLAVVALLAACSAQPDEPPVEPTPSASEPVSILRPEIKQPEQVKVALEPLSVVIGFPEGGAELDAAATAQLTAMLDTEQLASGAPVVLRGHSDAGGSDAVNERASLSRAEAVRDWLVKNGVAEERVEVIAFGEQNPVKPNALPDGSPNEAGRAANRRVEIEIIPPADPPAANPSSKPGD